MKFCNKCKSKNIKTRKNYSHGKNSNPTFVSRCGSCNSGDVGEEQRFRGGNKFGGRR